MGQLSAPWRVLEAAFDDRNFKVFLQGSYGNDTNIFAESDVDVVIRFDGAFYHDADKLPADQQASFNSTYPNGVYPYNSFRVRPNRLLEVLEGR